jgi:hypothetical protein
MIPIHDVSLGNWVQINLDGQTFAGRVDRKSVERIGVSAEGEMGWYFPEDIDPIPLTEDWLYRFNFQKSDDPALDGSGKAFTHGPFVIYYPNKEDDSYIILSCHGVHDEEFHHRLPVHEFQNHYHEMTKVFIQ